MQDKASFSHVTGRFQRYLAAASASVQSSTGCERLRQRVSTPLSQTSQADFSWGTRLQLRLSDINNKNQVKQRPVSRLIRRGLNCKGNSVYKSNRSLRDMEASKSICLRISNIPLRLWLLSQARSPWPRSIYVTKIMQSSR